MLSSWKEGDDLDFSIIAAAWTQAEMVHVQAIADRGVNEAHVSLADMQAMLAGIPAVALDMTPWLKETAASMRGFTRAPRKGLPELFGRVCDLCADIDKVYLAQSGKSAASGAAPGGTAAVSGDEVSESIVYTLDRYI